MAFNNLNFSGPGDYTAPSEYDLEFYLGDCFSILKGSSNAFIAVWTTTDGRLMAATEDTLSIVDLNTNALIDWYSQAHAGRTNEALISNDIVDIGS